MRHQRLLILAAISLAACAKQVDPIGIGPSYMQPIGSTRFASLNLKWLAESYNSGMNPRTAADYNAVAQVIDGLNASIICIQEAESSLAVSSLVLSNSGLGSKYSVATNEEGTQEIGVIWNNRYASVTPFAAPIGGFTRTPLFAYFRVGDFDGTIVVVHLKAGTDATSRTQRASEMASLQSWAISYAGTTGNDPDVIVCGDHNFDPSGNEIALNPALTFFNPSTMTLVSGSDAVDFFWITQDAKEEVLGTASAVMPNALYQYYNVSDHWPIKVEVNAQAGKRDQ